MRHQRPDFSVYLGSGVQIRVNYRSGEGRFRAGEPVYADGLARAVKAKTDNFWGVCAAGNWRGTIRLWVQGLLRHENAWIDMHSRPPVLMQICSKAGRYKPDDLFLPWNPEALKE